MEYLMTKTDLERVSVANLGPMIPGQYAQFMQQAKATGLAEPKLVIETKLKSPSYFGVTEVVYAIADFEWDEFAIDELAAYTPVVHVVDGNLYTTGI